MAHALTPADAKWPIGGRAAFGDLAGGMAIAGGIAAGLLQRATSGVAPIIDVSLLGLSMWVLSPDIVASGLYGGDPMPKFDRSATPNPLVGNYRTSDGRFITLMMLQADRFWSEFCTLVGRTDLITDPRFVDGASRFANRVDCIKEFDAIFAARTFEQWKQDLAPLSGAWAPVQMASELVDDPQVQANGYLPAAWPTARDGSAGTTWSPIRSRWTRPPTSCVPPPSTGSTPKRSCSSSGWTGTPSSPTRSRAPSCSRSRGGRLDVPPATPARYPGDPGSGIPPDQPESGGSRHGMQRGPHGLAGCCVQLTPGTRLRSGTDPTEVVVVRAAPADDIDLRCGGHPLTPIDSEPAAAAIEPGFDQGALVGKRYVDATSSDLEVLCTKGGPASLSIGSELLTIKGAKALPASD